MHFQSFFPSIYFLLVPIVYGQGLIDILKSNGYTEYAQNLLAFPELLANITSRNDVTIFAPKNNAPLASVPSFSNATSVNGTATNGNLTLPERPTETRPAVNVAINAACDGQLPLEKRQLSPGSPESNYRVLHTFVDNPAYVNLGGNQTARIVQNYAGPPPDGTESMVEIKSGAGALSNSISSPYKYDMGIIYGVDSYFKLPTSLGDTLAITGLTSFSSALKAAGLLESLSNTPAVTIFAPVHDSGSIDIPSHIVEHTLGYTPELAYGRSMTTQAGNKLKITLGDDGKSFYVNGIRIIRTDITIKNGVVHAIEKPLSTLPTLQTVSPTGSAVSPSLGAGMLLLSLAVIGYVL